MFSIRPILVHLVRKVSKRPLSSLLMLILFLGLILPLLLYHLLAYRLSNDRRLVPDSFRHAKNILLVTAHPDDETLFFSPSILYRSDDKSVTRSLVVLSRGDYRGLGETRHKELKRTCESLGIRPDRCSCLNLDELPDDPQEWWSDELIRQVLWRWIGEWDTDLVITFDSGGISGHINHRAVGEAISKYTQHFTYGPPIYALQTKSLVRKYSGLWDLMPTSMSYSQRIIGALFVSPPETSHSVTTGKDQSQLIDPYVDKALLVSDWSTYFRSRAAFAQHQSQYSWDRSLYLIFSRYMWFNDLKRV